LSRRQFAPIILVMKRNIAAITHKFLLKNKLSVAVAESCTGGLVSKLLTDLPGSSRFFLLGIVAYSNLAKKNILKIPAKVLTEEGAVSAKTASLLAKSIRRISGADLGIGITGIAGPTGGSKQKPVGTVFIAMVRKNRSICKEFHFTGDRDAVRKKAAIKALQLCHL